MEDIASLQTQAQTFDFKVKHVFNKRLFDLIFTICTLTFCFPLFIAIAFLIRFTSKGPVIYAHERIGRGGKKFNCFKFRTMYPDADLRLQELLKNNPPLLKEWNETRKLKNDPRVTPIGKFLRKTSLDELPQFLNVIKGDLSVVGPRPVVKMEVQKYMKDHAPIILSIRPGITGLWQVSGRNDTSYEKRVELDVHYVNCRSFFLDITLIIKTIPAMIFKNGAY